MQQRTELLHAAATGKLDALEKQCLADNAKHKKWECNEQTMSLTRDGKALYMHCLPADITGVSCDAGEVSADVFERARLDTYRQAAHKPFVIAAMILLAQFKQPATVLGQLLDEGTLRRF